MILHTCWSALEATSKKNIFTSAFELVSKKPTLKFACIIYFYAHVLWHFLSSYIYSEDKYTISGFVSDQNSKKTKAKCYDFVIDSHDFCFLQEPSVYKMNK